MHQSNSTMKTNIIDLSTAGFLPGSTAYHRIYRVCRVIAAKGAMRTIRTPQLGEPTVRMQEHTVHVKELRLLPKLQ